MHFLSVVLGRYSDPSHEDDYLDQSIPAGSRPVVKRVQFKRKKTRGALPGRWINSKSCFAVT